MQENMRKGLESAQEMAETAVMSAEDARSAIPVRRLLPSACIARGLPHTLCYSYYILLPGGIVGWPNMLYLKRLPYNVLYVCN